jgi:hypothetical protein
VGYNHLGDLRAGNPCALRRGPWRLKEMGKNRKRQRKPKKKRDKKETKQKKIDGSA